MSVAVNDSTTTLATRATRSAERRGRRILVALAYAILPVVALVLVWEWATTASPSMFFPAPSRIWTNSLKLFFSGGAETLMLTPAITVDAFGTVSRALIGFALGSIGGIVAGTVIGRSMLVRELTDPIVEFLRSIPATATLPLFIIVLGGEDGMRVAFISYTVLWFVLINTVAGVSSIHGTVLDMGRTFRIPTGKVFLRVMLPAALPKIFAGLRIAITVALLSAIVSELMLASNGIGYRLVIAQTQFRMADLWSWMVLLALIGFVFNTVMEAIERRVLAWDRLARVGG